MEVALLFSQIWKMKTVEKIYMSGNKSHVYVPYCPQTFKTSAPSKCSFFTQGKERGKMSQIEQR